MTVRLYLKALRTKRKPAILVLTSQQEGEGEMIVDAWYLPQNLIVENATPLNVLESLCRNFGLRIRVAGLADRLIYSQRVMPEQGKPANITPQLVDKSPAFGAKVDAIAMENDDGSVDISLMFAINVETLKQRLVG